MSSKGHDFILEMIHLKMIKMGFRIVSSDSRYSEIKFPLMPTIINHRPDSLGYNKDKDIVCIGEAKYYGDLTSERSKTQIRDLIGIAKDNRKKVKIIFGIPASEKENFNKDLKELKISLPKNSILLEIPDRLIPVPN
tara:strand:+ start:1097 stop:1507 length:411 start_codon:yes stop_codon:yes gene_type:complete